MTAQLTDEQLHLLQTLKDPHVEPLLGRHYRHMSAEERERTRREDLLNNLAWLARYHASGGPGYPRVTWMTPENYA